MSQRLFGIFFEEINLAGDGGIYPELVRNGSFEDAEAPDFWTLPQSGVTTSVKPTGIPGFNSRCLEVKFATDDSCIDNSGYFGMAIKKGEQYKLSIRILNPSSETPLTVPTHLKAGRNRRSSSGPTENRRRLGNDQPQHPRNWFRPQGETED